MVIPGAFSPTFRESGIERANSKPVRGRKIKSTKKSVSCLVPGLTTPIGATAASLAGRVAESVF